MFSMFSLFSSANSLAVILSVLAALPVLHVLLFSSYSIPSNLAMEKNCGASYSGFSCSFDGCNKVYTRKDNLKQHMKLAHDMPTVTKSGRFFCSNEECKQRFYHASQLVAHYKKEHNLDIVVEQKEFTSFSAFEIWKEQEEATVRCCFVQPTGKVTAPKKMKCGDHDHVRTVIYTCCRDGLYKQNNSPRITDSLRKSRETRKLGQNSYCLARMTATENLQTGKVCLHYISTHSNHELSLSENKHLPLPKSVKEDIQKKFAEGISIERIMDDIRKDIGRRGTRSHFEELATRKHFITKQDCINISRKVRDYTTHRHINDAISVDRIVGELHQETPSPVLVYKAQGRIEKTYPLLEENTFLLVLMTDFQAQLFSEFSRKIVCVDATHNTNQYGFQLVSLLVADEYRNGCPVAWAITNRQDANTFEVFFNSVKARCTSAEVYTLMTDDDLAGVTAFLRVYPHAHHFLCRWHVDRCWQQRVYSYVKESEHKADIYACLCMLGTELDEAKFNQDLQAFLNYWKDKQPKFISYFETYYTPRVEKWALCYRTFDHHETDTNMLVESFHNKLKTNPRYLAHKVNRRCDDLIEVLLKLEEDLFHDRMRKDHLRTPAEASQKCEGDIRHNNGMLIASESVKEISATKFEASSSKDESVTYQVDVLMDLCSSKPNCVPQCSMDKCGYLCRHMYRCTCYDYLHGHICKHIHKVHSIRSSCNCDLTNDHSVSDNEYHLENPTDHKKETSVEGRKKEIHQYLEQIASGISNVSDTNVLDRVLVQVMSAASSINAATDETMNEFTVVRKFGPAQKNETQLKFLKKKKATKQAKEKFKWPMASMKDGGVSKILAQSEQRLADSLADATVAQTPLQPPNRDQLSSSKEAPKVPLGEYRLKLSQILHLRVIDQELYEPLTLPPNGLNYSMLLIDLSLQSRSVDSIIADGNCFFRAISKELCGSQRHHYRMRQVISDFIKKNPAQFAGSVHQQHQISFEDYCAQMASPNKWATDLEIQAAASAFQLPIYTYVQQTPLQYHWLEFKPIDVSKLSCPNYGLLEGKKLQPTNYHVELLNFSSCHYDRIVPLKGTHYLPTPKLQGKVQDTITL